MGCFVACLTSQGSSSLILVVDIMATTTTDHSHAIWSDQTELDGGAVECCNNKSAGFLDRTSRLDEV